VTPPAFARLAEMCQASGLAEMCQASGLATQTGQTALTRIALMMAAKGDAVADITVGDCLPLSAEEFGAVAQAAARAGLTPSGYTAEASVATAHAAAGCTGVDAGVSRAELAQVQREPFAGRAAVVAAAAALDAVTSVGTKRDVAACAAAAAGLDELVTRPHGLLRRSAL
jgi:hypothetical protein